MERNLFLAVLLSMGVYVAWFSYMDRKSPPAAPYIEAPRPPEAKPFDAAAPAPPEATKPGATRPEISLKLEDAELRFSLHGGALSSYRFRGPMGYVELVEKPASLFASWPELPFQELKIRDGRALHLQARHPAGFDIRKTFRLGPAGQLSFMRIELRNPGRKAVQVPAWDFSIGPGLGTVESELKDNPQTLRAIGLFPPPAGRSKERVETLDPEASPSDWRWLAVDNRYFIAAVFPSSAEFSGYGVDNPPPDKLPRLRVIAKAETLAPGSVSIHDIPFYLGPKGYIHLKKLNRGLERSVDFGWFDSLGRLILRALQSLHRLTGNYGWSIILLTLLIQVLLFPLTFKSLKAAAAMRRLQPEIARVQQKFKQDPQRLNTELMQLYRSKGANPLGGCLPMLAQLPVFWALFTTLRNAWELHGSPWVLWVRDLSAHDPFYILPLIMGAVMFVQNKYTQPPAGDPTQAKIMTYMPLIFTFMFLNFPAGLVLYWLTNSLLSVAQQFALKDKLS